MAAGQQWVRSEFGVVLGIGQGGGSDGSDRALQVVGDARTDGRAPVADVPVGLEADALAPQVCGPVYHRYSRIPMVYKDARRALIDAAVEVIARRGVEAATTREIYLRAGVKAPTLYHHFGDKKGLLDAVVTDAFDRYLARKRALPGRAMRRPASARAGTCTSSSRALTRPFTG